MNQDVAQLAQVPFRVLRAVDHRFRHDLQERYAAAIGVMHRAYVFGIDVVCHLVTRGAEGHRVAQLHGPVESAPGQHPDRHEKQCGPHACTEQQRATEKAARSGVGVGLFF